MFGLAFGFPGFSGGASLRPVSTLLLSTVPSCDVNAVAFPFLLFGLAFRPPAPLPQDFAAVCRVLAISLPNVTTNLRQREQPELVVSAAITSFRNRALKTKNTVSGPESLHGDLLFTLLFAPSEQNNTEQPYRQREQPELVVSAAITSFRNRALKTKNTESGPESPHERLL
jgi:hypothetical protein